MTLKDLKKGQSAVIDTVGGEGALRQHFLDMGVIPGAEVTLVKRAPMGDPIELLIHGYELTLRVNDAEKIDVIPAEKKAKNTGKKTVTSPKYKPRRGEALADDTTLTYALVGNQNSGKTTLFNQLTGSNRHVGNFPGVTVDRRDGVIRGHGNTVITDLPGIYSMSPYSSEEIVSRNFVIEDKPTAIINILDATNIERNLYLTMQLLEMEVPMVVALNMMDEMTAGGGSVDIDAMSGILGVPVVAISAAKNRGVDELVDKALEAAKYQERPTGQKFCTELSEPVQQCIETVMKLISKNAENAGVPLRFAASKLIEGDPLITEQLNLTDKEKDIIEDIVSEMEKKRGLDRSAAIADMRFSFIIDMCGWAVVKPAESRERRRSERIDRLLTGKYTAIPMFILIMALVFYLTFSVIGARLQNLMETGVELLQSVTENALVSANVNGALTSLIVNGIFEGVGSVITFLPIIVTLFFFLSLLEDSGYIARVAFFMDKPLRKIGLSGKSIVPLLIGFGCTVPAVMATRTLPSERDRKMTIILTPFMSCTAKLPIYAFFVNALFPSHKAAIMTGLYVLGIVVGILAAFLYKKTLFKGEGVPFVMELPNYRMPTAKNIGQLLWEKAKDFLTRAFTVIFIATVVIWFLKSFDLHLHYVHNSQDSILAAAAGLIVPVFKPVGLGNWKIVTALISGFMAKESVVSTLDILFSDGIPSVLSTASAASLLVFSLLYTPCVAAVASIKRELGSKWAVGVVIWQCVIAWVVAFIVRLICIGIGL